MTYRHDFIPAVEADFDDFFKNYCQVVLRHTSGSTPEWSHIPADRVEELAAVYGAWHTAYLKLKEAHTHADVVAKDAAEKAGKAVLREFHNEFILYSRKVTDEQLAELGCERRDKTPTAIPAPSSQGMAEVQYGGVHEITLANIHAIGTLSADPRSDYGVSIHYGILEPGNPGGRFRIAAPPATGDDLPHSVFTRKKKHLFDFEGDTGKTVYFCLRYENEKGEAGPYGPIFSALIP